MENVKFFFYGTLIKTPFKDETIRKNAVLPNAKMYDLGSFPGCKLVKRTKTPIKGVLVAIPAARIPQLDQYEGIRNPGNPDNLYERVVAEVITEDNEKHEAFVYVFNQSTENCARIKDGDWIKHITAYYQDLNNRRGS